MNDHQLDTETTNGEETASLGKILQIGGAPDRYRSTGGGLWLELVVWLALDGQGWNVALLERVAGLFRRICGWPKRKIVAPRD
jgi:hypothetical protein